MAAPPDEDPADPAPLVVLVHGFLQCWSTWSPTIPALVAAGWRVAALDLRGAGASDKPPRGYDVPTLAADVEAVVRSLGAQQAVVVGAGLGAWVAWSMPALHPATTRAVAAVGAAHPLVAMGSRPTLASLRLGARLQAPFAPERDLREGDLVERVLRAGGPDAWVDDDVLDRYRAVAQVPFAARCAVEGWRWVARSRLRSDGRALRRALSAPMRVPVLAVHGADDALVPVAHARASAAHAGASHRLVVLPGVGHHVTEEAPGPLADVLVDWLGTVDPAARRGPHPLVQPPVDTGSRT